MPKYFNIEHLERETDASFARELLDMFVESTPSSIQMLKAAANEGDITQIEQIMHKIKSSLRILHVYELQDEAQSMEDLARNQGVVDEERITRFIRILEASVDEMRSFRRTGDG